MSLSFYPNDPENKVNVPKAKRPAGIGISEAKAEGPAPTPDPAGETLGWKFERAQVKGTDVWLRRSENPGSASMDLQARLGEVDIGLSANWSGDWTGDGRPPVVKLTPDMENEFFKIFESMLED